MTTETNLSLEDFMDLHEETVQDIAAETLVARRVSDTVQALECLCESLEDKEELTQDDVLRLQTADLFGTTGTDAEPGDIVPAFEAHTPTNVAMEGLLDNIQEGISSMAQSSSVISALVEKRFAGLGAVVKSFNRRQEELENTLRALNKNDKSPRTVSLKIDYAAEGGKIRTFADYLKLMDNNTKDLEQIVKVHVGKGNELQSSILRTLKSFVDTKYSKNMADTFNLFNNDVLRKVSSGWKVTFGTTHVTKYESSEFHGSKVIEIQISKNDMSDSDSRGIVRELIDNTGWQVIDAARRTGSRHKETITFEKVTASDIEKLLAINDRMQKALVDYQGNGSHFNVNSRKTYDTIYKTYVSGLYFGKGFTVSKVINNYAGIIAIFNKTAGPTAVQKLAILTGATVSTTGVGFAIGSGLMWLRKIILGWIFSTMKLQYRITDYMGFVDSRVIGLLITSASHNYTVINRYVK